MLGHARVRRLLTALLTSLVFSAGLASVPEATSAAGETGPPYDYESNPGRYELRVRPDYWCAHPDEMFECSTELVAETGFYWVEDDTWITSSLRNVRSGAKVPGFDFAVEGDSPNQLVAWEDGFQLPSGTYLYTVHYSDPGRWWCSEYNEEGCSWIEETRFTFRWKFRYVQGGSTTALPWKPPSTSVRNGFVNKKGKQRWAKGKVVSVLERANFTLTPPRAQKWRKVMVQKSGNGARWTTVRSGKTDRAGRFHIRWRMPKNASWYWRIAVPAKGSSPAGYAYVRGLWRGESARAVPERLDLGRSSSVRTDYPAGLR